MLAFSTHGEALALNSYSWCSSFGLLARELVGVIITGGEKRRSCNAPKIFESMERDVMHRIQKSAFRFFCAARMDIEIFMPPHIYSAHRM